MTFMDNFFAKRRAASFRPSRRQFLVGAAVAGAGLTIGFDAKAQAPAAAAVPNPFAGYLRIGTDNSVTVLSAHMDMGQGVYNGIATLVAEELGADWSTIRVDGASGNLALYGNVAWGGAAQGTGGSTAMASSWERYRKAGAIARTMLVSAAAKAWNVPASEIAVTKGTLFHAASGRGATFGAFADAAAREPVPQSVTLKAPSEWTLIGKQGQRRYDSASKTNGTQQFTIDVRFPGMLIATIQHPPVFGGKVASVDAGAAKAVPGVVDVVTVSTGVAVLAHDTWAAIKGREALQIVWDETGAETRGTAELRAEYLALLDKPGELVADLTGDAPAALGRAVKTIEATYEFPYLAHAALEPLNAVVRRQGDTIEIYGGHQIPDLYQALAARAAGTTPDKIAMRTMKTGGGFGRRAVGDGDVVIEAVEIAKAIGYRAPVKLQWTRETDMAGGRYRPMYAHKVRIGLDANGRLSGWHHRIVGQSILGGTPFAGMIQNGVDVTSVEGVAHTVYGIPDRRVELTTTKIGVPVLWWRSVGHTHTAYAMETALDEIATATGKDPVALRRELLAGKPRHLGVLELVAQRAKWGEKPAEGVFRGVAVHESFGTVVGMVAEIRMTSATEFKVERVVASVDCGVAINPDQVRAQIEGAVGFGLGAMLRERVTLDAGKVVETNYDAYRPLRMDEMPKVEVHIVSSSAPPTGIGEPGVPLIGPAVANAYAAATGKRIRALPFETALEQGV
jgi:isoquinoline 1-oxidoreductase subunit beta